jgi:hypothetical protein
VSTFTGVDPFARGDRRFGTKHTFFTPTLVSQSHPVPLGFSSLPGSLGLVHIHGVDDNHGSAVLLAPGLAVTASHVVAPYVDLFADGGIDILCLTPRPGGMDLWRVVTLAPVADWDVTFLSLSLVSEVEDGWDVHVASLTSRMPLPGDRVLIAGFNMEKAAGAWYGDPLVASGEVRKVYAGGRDRLLAPGPCIEIGCGALGGMSGGPVFDVDGRLLGIVQRGWGDGESPMVASWLLFSLFTSIPLEWPNWMYPEGLIPVINALPGGMLGRHRVRLDASSGEIDYLPWHRSADLEGDPRELWSDFDSDPDRVRIGLGEVWQER